MFLVYKLTRSDGGIYIGRTTKERFKSRMSQHKSHKRFKGFTFTYEILESEIPIELINEREAYYVSKYDSFNNGLNDTISGAGNHNSEKFTTLGYKFSEESKAKMRESKKNRVFTDEWRANLSKSLKGKTPWNVGKKMKPHKLSDADVLEIRSLYSLRPVMKDVGVIQQNGRPMSYEQSFSKYLAQEYNITPQFVKMIITNKTRIYV